MPWGSETVVWSVFLTQSHTASCIAPPIHLLLENTSLVPICQFICAKGKQWLREVEWVGSIFGRKGEDSRTRMACHWERAVLTVKSLNPQVAMSVSVGSSNVGWRSIQK